MNWPTLFDHKIERDELPWRDEADCVNFVHHQEQLTPACLWLSSCWPAFAPQHNRDIIAGGFYAWVVAQEQHTLIIDDQTHPHTQDTLPTDWLQAQLQEDNTLPATLVRPGWFGGLSYDYNGKSVGLKTCVQAESRWPGCQLGFARWVITLEHQSQTATLLTLGLNKSARTKLIRLWQKTPKYQPQLKITPWTPTLTQLEYQKGFDRIQDYIDAGDCYQVNYTQRFDAHWQGQPLAGFVRLKDESPSPYAAYWFSPYGIVCSQSPELLLQAASEAHLMQVRTKPIKGTSKRYADAHEDALAAKALQQSPKNRAENSMIVDLLRNDLSRHAVPGSMKVPQLCAIESFAHVHHLVSEVCAQVTGVTAIDILLDCFPGGSITGAPKRRAMEIIDELEIAPRAIYCGSLGFWDQPKSCVFNITIRTLLFRTETQSVSIWAGGGIVKDSTAAEEYAECFHKVGKLMKALEPLQD